MADRRHKYFTYPVLCVDDEEQNLLVLQLSLADKFTLLQASSYEEAREILDRGEASVLLTDHRLGAGQPTGIDLCEYAAKRHPKVRRILVTAYSDQDTAIDALNRGRVSSYISKPWNRDELRHTLERSIEDILQAELNNSLVEHLLRAERAGIIADLRGNALQDLANVHMVLLAAGREIKDAIADLEDKLPPEAQEEGWLRGICEALSRHELASKLLLSQPERILPAHTVSSQSSRTIVRASTVLRAVVGLSHRGRRVAVEQQIGRDFELITDPADLAHCLLALVTNALEATERHGPPGERALVRVTAHHGEDDAHFDVIDQGDGLPDSVREGLDHPADAPFHALGAQGWGLFSVRRRIADLGGRLTTVHSDSSGTTLRITVPLEPPALKPESPEAV